MVPLVIAYFDESTEDAEMETFCPLTTGSGFNLTFKTVISDPAGLYYERKKVNYILYISIFSVFYAQSHHPA